jgi:hypothetical protein
VPVPISSHIYLSRLARARAVQVATAAAIDDRPSCFRFPRGNGLGLDLAAAGITKDFKVNGRCGLLYEIVGRCSGIGGVGGGSLAAAGISDEGLACEPWFVFLHRLQRRDCRAVNLFSAVLGS